MNRSYLLAAATATALLASAGVANAQQTRLNSVPAGGVSNPGYSANVFQPSERGSDWNGNDSLDLRGDFRLAIGVIGDHEYRGIITSYNQDGTVGASTLRNQVLIHPGLSMVFGDHIRLSGSMPIAVYQDGFVSPNPVQPSNQFFRAPQNEASAGDIRVGLDFKLAGEYGKPFSLAVGAQGYAPGGAAQQLHRRWRVSRRSAHPDRRRLLRVRLRARRRVHVQRVHGELRRHPRRVRPEGERRSSACTSSTSTCSSVRRPSPTR